MITERRRNLERELMFLRMQDQRKLISKEEIQVKMSTTDGMASNPSAMNKLAKITFDAVRRL